MILEDLGRLTLASSIGQKQKNLPLLMCCAPKQKHSNQPITPSITCCAMIPNFPLFASSKKRHLQKV